MPRVFPPDPLAGNGGEWAKKQTRYPKSFPLLQGECIKPIDFTSRLIGAHLLLL